MAKAGVSVAATTPAVHSDMLEVLEAYEALGGEPVHTLGAREARRQPGLSQAVDAVLALRGRSLEPERVARLDHRVIPGPAGEIAAQTYTPRLSGPAPVILYIHGGAWVLGDLGRYDRSARALANATGAIVVATHYRQAPEHRFPAAHDDTFAAYRWTIDHARLLGGDPHRIVVAGEGAGGNMALNVCLRARAEGLPMPRHQVLIYPVADTDLETESYREHEHARPLDKATMAWAFSHLLGAKGQADDPRLRLVAREDLGGLPPATVITAEFDPLRSEGQALAGALERSGVDVRHRDFEGVTHDFFGLGEVVSAAMDAVAFAADGIRRGLVTARVADTTTQPVIAP